MSGEAGFVREWTVGKFTATLTVPKVVPGAVVCALVEWSPKLPGRLSAAEYADYQRGLNAAIREMRAQGLEA